jgi:glycosyltransferase involved in cell wall biosynthesis
VQPVLVFSRPLPPEIESRLRGGGARIQTIDYGAGLFHYWRTLRRLVRDLSVTTAHVVFFDYFSALPWIARLSGIHYIIYEMQNSGEFRATSWRKWLLRIRTRLMTKPVIRVIAISEFVKEQLVRAGVPTRKIVVRHLGVDTERFTPDREARARWVERFRIPPDALVLSTVSYLRPFKNPQVLVMACDEIRKRGVEARLFVAGDGDMLPSLRALAERLGIGERVHWLGNVQDPKHLLQASDIFLLASVGEAFGLVLAEAMACGVPIVGSRSGSLAEVVDEPRTGLLCTPLDTRGFADAIESLAKDAILRRLMGQQAADRARTYFTVDLAVAKTVEIYDALWSER